MHMGRDGRQASLAEPKLLHALHTCSAAGEVSKSPRTSVVSSEGTHEDPPARSLLSEICNDPAAAPSSTETPASVWRQGSAYQVFACSSHSLILPPKEHNLRVSHGPLAPQKSQLLPPTSLKLGKPRCWGCGTFGIEQFKGGFA